MFRKTEALAVRVSPYSNTSDVVTWLTPRFGKIATTFKGAKRPKSSFLGQYDLCYTCELTFYARDREGLHIARECVPLRTRPGLRCDFRAFSCASYACDVACRAVERGVEQQELYELTTSLLDCLDEGAQALNALFWFEARVLSVLGVGPHLARCVSCDGEPFPRGATGASFSTPLGGVVCRECAPGDPQDEGTASSVTVSPGALALLRNWQQAPGTRALRATRTTSKQSFELRSILGTFLPYHLDITPVSRKVALETIGLRFTGRGDGEEE